MSGKKTEMIHIVLDDGKERSLVFYLAMEEYLARYTEDEAFFVWQVQESGDGGGGQSPLLPCPWYPCLPQKERGRLRVF